MSRAFDLVVIGGGAAGFKAAITAARLGARVALVERSLDGGTCLNEGCIPSQALRHPAALLEQASKLSGRGVKGALAGDFEAAVRHKNGVVASLRETVAPTLARLGIAQFRGSARFDAPRRVQVGEAVLASERVIIATGSRPRAPAEWPVDGETVITSHEFHTRLERLPRRMLIVGGGPLGVELAYIAALFGTEVTLVEREERLLPRARVPEHAASLLESRLERLGVRVCTAMTSRPRERYDVALVAAGRVPNADGLGLHKLGISLDADGAIPTDAYLETKEPGVYAIGDVRGGLMTANSALYDAKLAAANALTASRVPADSLKVPFVVRSALEIATVGLLEAEAQAAGFKPRVARARLEADSFVEMVHDAASGRLLGGCVVGAEAGEHIHLLGAAYQSRRGARFFADLCYSHPSRAEQMESAAEAHAYA